MTRVVAAFAVVFLLVGRGGDSANDSSVVTLRIMAATDANVLLAKGGVTLVDVRTHDEFAAGHIANARLLDFQRPDFKARIEVLPRDAKYVVYCAHGGRSEQASKVMQGLGFTNVTQIEGDLASWMIAGLPVVTS